MQPVARRAQSPTQEVTCPQTPDRFRASLPVRESALVSTISTHLILENSGESVWTHCKSTRRIRMVRTRLPSSHCATSQLTLLQDLWDNKPASFNNIRPSDFAYELTFMTWAGFLMDPIYGGNQNMVGWTYTGFNGVNFGNFYREGKDQKALMVATTPTRLKPASLAQYQQQASG